MRRARLGLAACALAACNSFQDPNVVVDLRVLAMAATPADQVLDVDLTQPVDPRALLAQMVPTRVCALVADPPTRRLRWRMTMCKPTSDQRCDDTDTLLGAGVIEDPELAAPAPTLCGTATPDLALLALLLDIVDEDALRGLGGIDYQVTLRIGGEDDDPALDVFAGKTLRVSPRVPATRTANANPYLTRFDAAIGDEPPAPLPLGRCRDNPTPRELAPGAKLRITPVEPDEVRETYVIPTLDGQAQTFTENLRYQWIAGAGGFSKGTTGGRRDVSGNPPPLFSDFRAPDREEVAEPTDIPLWIIQRDERLGTAWYEACLRVVP